MKRLLTAAAPSCSVPLCASAWQKMLGLVLAVGLTAGALPAAAQTAPPPSPTPPPNIVVFLVDDMGVMDTSVPFLTGEDGRPVRYPLNDYYRTPNMERLAARGIRFSNFMAMSVCSPTRISIMTGQNAARHRTTNWIDPAANNRDAQGPPDWNWRGLTKAAATLPSLLCAAGYRTIHVGKAHFGPNDSEGADPLNLGFDVNVGGRAIGHPGSYYGRDAYGKGGTHAVPGLERYHGTETFLTDALTNEAEARVADAVAARRPFYLNMAHYAVHAPFQSDPRYAAHYAASGKPAPAQAFATLIEGMDASLGRLLDHLDRLGVAGNTLIFFLGDNGSDAPLGHQHAVASAAPLRGKKGSHYEGGMRVPFIAAWARPDPANPHQRRLPIAVGGVQGQIASVCDLFPTVLGSAGVAAPERREVVRAVFVRKVHQELVRLGGVAPPGQQHVERRAIHHVAGRWGDARGREDGREQVADRRELALHRAGGDRQPALMRICRIRPCPRRDEGHPHAAFVVRAFLAAQRGRARDGVLVAERRVRTVVAQEEHERIPGHAQSVEVVEQPSQRGVHAFDQGRERLRGRGSSRRRVVRRVAGVALERRVDCVVGHVQKERPAFGHGPGHARLGFQRERVGEKRVRAVVALEVRHGVRAAPAVRVPAVVAAGMADGPPAHVHVESEIQRVGALRVVGAEVRLPDVDRAVAAGAQQRRQCD